PVDARSLRPRVTPTVLAHLSPVRISAVNRPDRRADWRQSAGQGALMEVRQRLPRKVLAPSSAKFLMSTPLAEGWPMITCPGGSATLRFRRMTFPEAPAARNTPFEFPRSVLSSITLPVSLAVMRPMPKLFPCSTIPFPPSRFRRSRLRLAPPASHMPPQGLLAFPLRTTTLRLTWGSGPPETKSPEKQLVEIVTREIVAPLLVRSRMPWPRNC